MLRVVSCRGVARLGAAPRVVALRRLSDALAVPTPKSEQKSDVSAQVLEPVEKSAVSRFTGAPVEQMDKRTLKIYQQAPTVVGGVQNTLSWKVQWEDSYTQRWTNPLMGWTSTNDPLSNTHMMMDFMTKEDAIKFAQSNGWSFIVQETSHVNRQLAASGPLKYADNFRWKGTPPPPVTPPPPGSLTSTPPGPAPPPPPPLALALTFALRPHLLHPGSTQSVPPIAPQAARRRPKNIGHSRTCTSRHRRPSRARAGA
jgi:NADH dehydrogenase (ubiquinone) Fe-S protein 4